MDVEPLAGPPRRQFQVPLTDGATVCVRVYGEGRRLILSHGNGLAIDAYRTFWARLVPDFEVVVFDFRHHGQSSPYSGPVRNWPQFIADFGVVLDAIDDTLGPAEPVGVFHSMSALTCLLHAGSGQAAWRGLVLFEPPIRPPRFSDLPAFDAYHRTLVDGALRRREVFDTPDRLVRSYRNHPAFSRLGDAALQDLVTSTLRERPSTGSEGRWVLACDRLMEAETFRLQDLPSDAWERATRMSCPTLIVSSDPDSGQPPILLEAAAALAEAGGYAHRSVLDATHFLQVEQPETCVAIVRDFVGSLDAKPDAATDRPEQEALGQNMSKVAYAPHARSLQETYRDDGLWNDDLLIDYLERWAQETPDKVALFVPGGPMLTYAQLLERARRFANALHAVGLRQGDVVAIQLPSNADFLVTYFGVLILGGVLCTLHMPYREGEMRPLLRFSKASAVVCGPSNERYDAPAAMSLLRSEIPTIEHVIVAGGTAPAGSLSMAEMIAEASSAPRPERARASDPCLLCFTSGTSAAPKGVVRTSETITANARIYSASIALTANDRVMIAPPFTHVFGLCCVANAIYCGAPIILLPLYTPAEYARTIADGKPTVLFTAPAHVAAALKGAQLDGVDLSSLRDVVIAGSVCPPNVARALEDIMPNGRSGGLFGMTECVLVTQTPLDGDAAIRHSSVGRATHGIRARVMDGEGRIGAVGEEGELQLSGYSVMAGYLDNDAENGAAFTEDGYFRTGDLAMIDADGNIFITGRVKDLINRGGIKINPTDIEAVIDLHDRVLQSAVVSVPDEIYGERACVFIVPMGDVPPTLGDLTDHLSANGVAKLRWPERLEIIAEMPMTPTRKIMKSVLRSRLVLQA